MTHIPSLSLDDVDEFIDDYFPTAGATLLVGNVGFSADVLYFPARLGALPNVDMRFFHERRPAVSAVITQLADQRVDELRKLAARPMQVADVAILAEDGAPVGGRNACAQVDQWLKEKTYTDVVVDATGMSRCTAFPIVKLLYQQSQKTGVRVHLLVADSNQTFANVESVSNDRGDWMHGFPAKSETDDFAKALKLWVVQLSEKAGTSLQTMFRELDSPEEVCPVLPFPAANPRRADDLLFEHREYWQREWFESPLNFIRAHETDPMDVFHSIVRLHATRVEALLGSGLMSQTILSPVGRRLPGIGMLLAALSYGLPIFYLETVGYDVHGALVPDTVGTPTHRWHFRVDKLVPASD
ncbi:hypothetical protein PEC18_29465 [Paucibacter sp. O1-1]|nr:hypothetical protein [Paucibacter sp. O1-1]MDA3829870.1 hypothetical protein [Paucibacter sp. O1-1]